MNIKHIGGIIQSLLLIVYLSFEPIHYQLVLASSGLLLQLIALKWISRQELLVEMASWLLIIPMAIIINNVQSAIFITVQLLYMKPSKFLFLRITFIILFAIVLDSEIHTLILTIVSLIIYILVPILEQPKVSSSPSQSTKKSASESEQESHIKMHFRSLICSECNPEQRTNIQDQFLQIFDQFPDGVVIVTFDENRLPIIDFSNQTVLNLLNTSQQDLLITLMSLKNLRVMKKNEQQKDLALSISTLRSQYPTSDKPTIGVVRKMVRAATTFHQQSNEHFVNGKLKFSKNPFQIALEQAILQIHSHDVQMLLEKTQIAFDLHTILYGYTQKGKRDIHLEIKLFISFLNNKPKLLILTRDVSYKDYIKIINQHSKAKSNSLNFVTHELRTPLNCIIQLLEELDQKNDNIKTALLNCQYLYNFSNDLMDLAQIKVGKFQLNKKEFNLENLIFSVFELFKVESKRKKIDLKIDYDKELPRQIFNDERRVKQVLINLIGNAFKFTVEGSITVKVELNLDNTLKLFIIDTGLGVREDDKKKLLKAFGKLEDDESKNCNRNGVGLGLLISNMICKSLSAKETGINIDSQLYKGSTFAFVIDYQIDFDQVNSQIHETESFVEDLELCVQPRIQRIYSNQAFKQRELLIIDDNQFNIDMLVRLFNSNGITKIDYAINCHNALQIIDKNIQNHIYYRLILLDIEMPIINGFETAKMIKQYVDETMATMPIIIAISGHGMYMKKEALENGFKDYYEKPLKASDVQQIISRYLC